MKVSHYKRTLRQDMIGKRVTSVREMSNHYGTLPAGTHFTIKDKSGGLLLEADPCETCGVGLRISKVEPTAVGDAY